MPKQKLYRNGNSVAVTIPKDYLKQLILTEDSEVTVDLLEDSLVVKPIHKPLAPEVDPKFMKMVDDFISKHEDVLTELSKR